MKGSNECSIHIFQSLISCYVSTILIKRYQLVTGRPNEPHRQVPLFSNKLPKMLKLPSSSSHHDTRVRNPYRAGHEPRQGQLQEQN